MTVLFTSISSLAACITDESDPVTALCRRLTNKAGESIARAVVSVKDESGQVLLTAESDKDGLYQVHGLKPGTYRVSVDAAHYLRHRYTLLVSETSNKLVQTLQLIPNSECRDIAPADQQKD